MNHFPQVVKMVNHIVDANDMVHKLIKGHLKINNKEIEACRLELIELYSGKKPEWKGWHNLILNISDKPGDTKVIAGPIDPETSKQLQVSINAVRTNNEQVI